MRPVQHVTLLSQRERALIGDAPNYTSNFNVRVPRPLRKLSSEGS